LRQPVIDNVYQLVRHTALPYSIKWINVPALAAIIAAMEVCTGSDPPVWGTAGAWAASISFKLKSATDMTAA